MPSDLITLSAEEMNACVSDPMILRALADWHSVQETLADGCDMQHCADHHKARYKYLRTVAERIEQEWEQ